jgi:hypothetical protein
MERQGRSLDNRDLDAAAVDALTEVQNMPPGPERDQAIRRATGMRNASEIYNYLFSSELRRPE